MAETTPAENTTDETDRYDQNIYNIEVGEEMVEFETVPCDPSEHVGDRAVAVLLGANDNDVRKVTLCTECQQVTEEVVYDDVLGLVLEGLGTNHDRLHNYPGDEELVTLPKDEVLDEAAADAGYDDYEVTHAGHSDDELLVKVTPTEEA